MSHFFKKTGPILIVLIISGLLFFGYNYTARNLSLYISRVSEEKFNAKVSVSRVVLGFPLYLEFKDVKIDDYIDVASVRIYPSAASFLSLLKKNLVISRVDIIDPVVKIKRKENKDLGIVDFLNSKRDVIISKISSANFLLSKIRIQNGTLIYNEGNENPLEFVKITGDFRTQGIYFSKKGVFRFAVAGFLKSQNSDFSSPLKLSGQVEDGDVVEAKLSVNDLKISTLGPLYAEYLSRVVEDCRVDFNSDIQISSGLMKARCFLKGEDIVLKAKPEDKIDTSFIASFIIFRNLKNRIVKVKNFQSNFLDFILERS